MDEAQTEHKQAASSGQVKLLLKLAEVGLGIIGFVYGLGRAAAESIPQFTSSFLYGCIAVLIATILLRVALRKQLRSRANMRQILNWLTYGAIILLFASIYAKFYIINGWYFKTTDEQAIQYRISTEHLLAGESDQIEYAKYFTPDARIEQHEPGHESIWQGITRPHPGTSGTLMEAYTNNPSPDYLKTHYKKVFPAPPCLSADKSVVVARTQTYFRNFEISSWTPRLWEVWIVKRVGSVWLIQEIHGGLSDEESFARYREAVEMPR